MVNAQLLEAGCTVYSPWIPRGGDNLIATLEVVEIGSGGRIDVFVWTKNSEDVGPGTDASGTLKITLTAVGRGDEEWIGDAKEWVRYKIVVTGNWVLFRMLSPVWFDSVQA